MHRIAFVAGALAVSATLACGSQFAISSSLATSDGTTNEDSDTNPEDATTWLVISAILAATSIALSVTEVSGDDSYAYLKQHQQDVRRALASGDGPFPSDLAQSLGLPLRELPRVAQIVRAGRPWLAPHLDAAPVSAESAREFWGQLLLLLKADALTGPRVERLELRARQLVDGV